MKRFWLVLLSLGLVMAFSASVFAADVKFSGSFYAAGMYLDNTTMMDKEETGNSTAFYYQRLRVQMDFIATPYLKLVTRFDAMERIWGGVRSNPVSAARWDVDSYGTRAENENIAFDWAYIWYASKIGIWSVGIIEDGAWGTKFGDNARPEGKIAWMMVKMPFIVGLQIVKLQENSKAFINGATALGTAYGTQTDVDNDKYQGYFIYNFKGGNIAGQTGVLGYYVRAAANKPDTAWGGGGLKVDLYGLVPYVKAKIGPVAIEGEFHYQWGKQNYSGVGVDDNKYRSWYAYGDALADFGMWYVGGTAAYVTGDDKADNKIEDNLHGGTDYNPMLLMWNWDRAYWAGNLPGTGWVDDGLMRNILFLAVRGGVRPIADLDIMAQVAYAQANEDGGGGTLATNAMEDKDYGWEVDVTATYKITNNLSYMLGVGYLFTGDAYKAKGTTLDVDDNFIVVNKLTLTF